MPLEPNRALIRHRLEQIAWEKTPRDYRGSSGARREVLLNTTEGATLVPLGDLTDYQLRRYIGPQALEEAGDMAKNGRGISGRRENAVFIVGDYVEPKDGGEGTVTDLFYEDGHPTYMLKMRNGDRLAYRQRDLRIPKEWQHMLQNAPGRREEPDETAARELSLYIENEYSLVGAPNSIGKAIEKNLLRKIKAGKFDFALSEKAWMYLMDAGAKKYCEGQTGSGAWNKIFNKPTRELVAHEFATTFAEEHGVSKAMARNAHIEIAEFDAPAHWASAFINGDTSGLEDEDLAELEAWQAKHPELGWVVDASEEPHIGRWNGLQTELLTYTAHVQPEELAPNARIKKET